MEWLRTTEEWLAAVLEQLNSGKIEVDREAIAFLEATINWDWNEEDDKRM